MPGCSIRHAGIRVEIALYADGIFHGNRQPAGNAGRAFADSGQVLTAHDFDDTTEEEWRIFASGVNARGISPSAKWSSWRSRGDAASGISVDCESVVGGRTEHVVPIEVYTVLPVGPGRGWGCRGSSLARMVESSAP
jgi:hypothetical protein